MIHPTAIIEPGAKLGAGTSVGPYAIVEAGAETGEGCVLAAHSILRRGAVLGKNVRVDSFAVVGGDPQDLRFDMAVRSGVRVGDGAVLREGVTIHRSTKPGGFTEVGEGALLMGYSHVGHDCHVGTRVILGNCALLAGHIEVGEGSFLSGGAVFHQFMRIGEGVMVSGNARIGLDIPPFCMAAERNGLHGLNIVGMKRRGFDAKAVADVKKLYHHVFAKGSPRANATSATEAKMAKTDAGKKFLAFFVESKRGYLRPSRGAVDNSDEGGE